MYQSVTLCVCSVDCGKMADCKWMPFRVPGVGLTGSKDQASRRVEIAPLEWAILGVNVGHPIVTNNQRELCGIVVQKCLKRLRCHLGQLVGVVY